MTRQQIRPRAVASCLILSQILGWSGRDVQCISFVTVCRETRNLISCVLTQQRTELRWSKLMASISPADDRLACTWAISGIEFTVSGGVLLGNSRLCTWI